MTYHQEIILAMELNRSHIGKLIQIITDSWSMTGTLARVDQHDNREWEIVWPDHGLVPSGGEIYTVLKIGPWEGRVIGNQPVTVETVKGTLVAPERAAQLPPGAPSWQEMHEAREIIRGGGVENLPALEGVVLDLPSTRWDVHRLRAADRRFTLCGLRTEPDGAGGLALTQTPEDVTCRECIRRDALPPEPPAEWHKR